VQREQNARDQVGGHLVGGGQDVGAAGEELRRAPRREDEVGKGDGERRRENPGDGRDPRAPLARRRRHDPDGHRDGQRDRDDPARRVGVHAGRGDRPRAERGPAARRDPPQPIEGEREQHDDEWGGDRAQPGAAVVEEPEGGRGEEGREGHRQPRRDAAREERRAHDGRDGAGPARQVHRERPAAQELEHEGSEVDVTGLHRVADHRGDRGEGPRVEKPETAQGLLGRVVREPGRAVSRPIASPAR
jgi:hypothetical protein